MVVALGCKQVVRSGCWYGLLARQPPAWRTPVVNVGLIRRPKKDGNSTMHLFLVPSHAGRTLGAVGNVGDGGEWEDRRRYALDLELQELQVID